MNEPQPLIEVKDVSFRYGATPVLDEVSLSIAARDFLAVIGPNGSGKSTLVKIILGLLKPKTGSIRILGQDLAHFRDWSALGYVPQKATHFDPLFPVSVREAAAMGLLSQPQARRPSGKERRRVVWEALARVGLAELADRRIGALSGGQQQRVFIARALVSQPQVLFLDEPTAGVDAEMQYKFYELLGDLNREQGLTVVLVTHDIGVVTTHVNKVACINQRLVFHGSHQEFCDHAAIHKLFGEDSHIICHRH